jgi:hypothetical protein
MTDDDSSFALQRLLLEALHQAVSDEMARHLAELV